VFIVRRCLHRHYSDVDVHVQYNVWFANGPFPDCIQGSRSALAKDSLGFIERANSASYYVKRQTFILGIISSYVVLKFVSHGIWRELLTAISRNSVESHDDGTRKWYFPLAVSEATHDEWTVRPILLRLGLFSDIKSLRADVTDFHARQGIVLADVEITSFYSLRPD